MLSPRLCRYVVTFVVTALCACTPTLQRSDANLASDTAIIAAAHPLAVDAGLEVLRNGGNAVDAAVAIQTMLGLVEPQSSGVGGGAFLMYYDAKTGTVTALNGRETAPAGATPDMFLDKEGKPIPFREAWQSGRSTGVPGAMALLGQAHKKLGARPWKELFAPAIRAANAGYPVTGRTTRYLKYATPETLELFKRPDGSIVQTGDIVRRPAYAQTLERMAGEGAEVLYHGPIAEEIVKQIQAPPLAGTMTLQDLASFEPEWVKPICRPYRVYVVCVPPPPSSGVSLLQMLAVLENTDIAARGPNDPQAWYLFAEASRLMYADRDRYVADPDFISVPVDQLLDPAYIRERAKLIGAQAGAAPAAGQVANLQRGRDATDESSGTSHFVVVDHAGNAVSMTTTVESAFGSGRVVGGFLLNNQLTDFSKIPVDANGPVANAVAGGKRPRSSMAPLIVLDRQGKLVAALGSPGGSAILAYNAKALVALLAWNLPMQQAFALPNLVARGDRFGGEVSEFSPEILAGLRARGIDLKPGQGEDSGLHGVSRLSASSSTGGGWDGGADPRRDGVVRTLPATR